MTSGVAALLAVAVFAFQAPELAIAAGHGCVTPGNDGPNAALTGVVNSYYPATASAAAGTNSISVGARVPGASPAIAPGDLLLVIQMQDADISGANAVTYGDGATGRGSTGLRSTGLYEYALATAVAAGVVTIAGTGAGNGLVNSYDFSNVVTATNGVRTFQVIRVPQYSSATLGAGLTVAAWDGVTHTGGVLAIDVAGALNLNSQTVNVDQRGFKGGLGVMQAGPAAGATGTDYVITSGHGQHGYKAEGIAGTPRFLYDAIAAAQVVSGAADGYPSGDAARGAPGNAGGGGTDSSPSNNAENTGGGGGGNGGQGGMGGNAWNSNQPVGGLGGATFPAAATRVILGGGGGAGTRNNSAGFASSGGTGGGIIMFRTGSLAGTGTISANGGFGAPPPVGVVPANDSGGGGGAGGSVVVSTSTGTVNGLTIRANGGNGINAWPAGPAGAANYHGPGAGGAGGVIITSNALPPAQASVVGGAHGTTTPDLAPYGSTDGAVGIVLTTAPAAIPGSSSGAECVPALTVVKSTSTPNVTNTLSGTTATYSITAGNAANTATATGVSVSDTLPAGFTYASTGSIALSGGATRTAVVNPVVGAATPAFGTFSIPASGSVVITFTVNIAAGVAPGTYSNPAAATYLDPARTSAGGTASSPYAGGGAERVTVLPLLPNTSAPGSDSGVLARDPAEAPPGQSLFLLAVVALAGVLGLVGIGRRRGGSRYGSRRHRSHLRRRPARLAFGAVTLMLSLPLASLSLSQFTARPSTGVAVLHATGITGPSTHTELIGNKVVMVHAPAPPASAPAATVVAESFHPAAGPITPSRLRVPSIGVDAQVGVVGLLPDGSMDVPDNPWTSSWLSTGPRPGDAGKAVIAGHRGVGRPALFSHLENVKPGDRIFVSDATGAEVVYEVTRVAALDLSLSTQIEVFGTTADQQLVLITCIGKYVNSTRTYDHRLVVFGVQLPPNV